jgi:hypothetical protein
VADPGCGIPPTFIAFRRPMLRGVTSRLEIELSSRSSAFRLEDHLKALHPLAVGRHGSWHVEVEVDDCDVDAALLATRDWLESQDEVAVVSLRR